MQNKTQDTPLKDSFVFYRSYFEAICDLTDKEQLKIYSAISNYSLNLIEPELIGICKTVWTLIKPQIQANHKRWVDGNKSKNGGRPQKNKPSGFISENPNENDNSNSNENKNENENPTHSQFLDFKYYKTEYETLPMEIQQEIKKRYWDSWQNLNNLIDTEYQNIRKISKQINYTEYLKIKQDYITSNSIKTDTFTKLLSDFNNYKGIENKYDSVYPAICKWIEIENRK